MKLLAVLTLLATTSFTAIDSVLEYDFEPPAFAADQHGQILHYYMAPHDGFAANINLMAQPYEDTLEAYDELSQGQFKQMGLTLISNELKHGVLTYEYKGKMQGRELHWYSRALKRGDTVYIVTVSVLAKRWEKDSPALIKSAQSFGLK